MTVDTLIIPIALCVPAILLEILSLIDSRSIIVENVAELKKIKLLFFAGIIQAVSYIVEYILFCYLFFGSRTFGMIVETVLFIANLYYLFSYADLLFTKYEKKLSEKRISRLLFLSPLLVLAVLYIVNIFYPIFFNLLPDTFEYVETDWIFIINVISVLYIIFSAINDIKESKQNTHYYNLPLSLFFTIVVIGIVLENFFYDYPIIPTCCCISMIIMYSRILKRVGYIDSLSGLFTRSQMLKYLSGVISTKQLSKKILAGIMIDINGFKIINDTYGHLAGDRSIEIVGNILRQETKENGLSFRYGGDEFIVLMLTTHVREVEDLMFRINVAVGKLNSLKQEKFELTLSQGYTVYGKNNDSINDFIERMDLEMYKNKRSTRWIKN